jgi:catechol 2,3-dioxygenase-like lactoylglutathione lyase family enzyme
MASDHRGIPGQVTGLAGVILWTSAERYPALRDFYRDTLGLRPRSDREHFISFDWAAVEARAPRLTITVHSQVRGDARDPLRTMVNLEVTDLDALHARLVEAGVVFVRPPEVEHFGGRIATLRDPDDNLVQLLEHPAA